MHRIHKPITILALLAMFSCSSGNNASNGGGATAGNNLDLTFRYADGTPFTGGTWWIQNDNLGQTAGFMALTDPFTGVTCDDPPAGATAYGCIDSDGHGYVPNFCSDTSSSSTETITIHLVDSDGTVGSTEVSCAAVGSGDTDVGGTSDIGGEITGIVLYQTTATTDGNIGGRAGADAMCETAKPAGLSQTAVRAFIGVDSGEDQLRYLNFNFGVPVDQAVHGKNGVEIASDWSDLLDGTIAVPLEDAGVTASDYWSGSLDDGSSPGDNCNGWTSNAAGGGGPISMVAYSGAIGDGSVTQEGWLGIAPEDCSQQHVILCIAFDPVLVH